MIRKIISGFVLGLFIIAFGAPVHASNSDVAKEKRWAEQVIDGLLDGDELWLTDTSGHEFLGILTEGDTNSGRAVILVHGIGVHPNWPDVIYPLREGLLEHGTTTLSIQMPILANDAESGDYKQLFAEVPGRFVAARQYLNENGYETVTIVAHSMGTSMSAYYLTRIKQHGIESFVSIGMGTGILEADNSELLKMIDIDILDLYGSKDLEPVVTNADRRATAANSRAGKQFLQIKVDGASHFFQGHEDSLKQHVIDWLDSRSN